MVSMWRRSLPSLTLLLGFPLAFHLTLSRWAFNPTDEGFTLAYGRRILDGQVPHRDFISVRPVGSPLMHLPELLVGGDYIFWMSRATTWFEWGVTAWAVSLIACHAFGFDRHGGLRTAIGGLAFVGAAHNMVPMAWHTIDGLMLVCLGAAILWTGERRWTAYVGWILVGLSAVAKQNFALACLVLLPLVPTLRRRGWWLAATPMAAYFALMAALGAFRETRVQLFSLSGGFLDKAVVAYALNPLVYAGVILGVVATALLARTAPLPGAYARLSPAAPAIALGCIALVAVGTGIGLLQGLQFMFASYLPFGFALGAMAWLAGNPASDIPPAAWKAGVALLGLAWVAGISLGYTGPAMGAGLCLAVVAAALIQRSSLPATPRIRTRVAALAVVFVAAFLLARVTSTYLATPVWDQTERLDDLHPGTSGIRVDENPRAFYEDLATAIALAEDRPYAILPDLAAWWATTSQANPLLLDWPNDTELMDPEVRARFLDDLDSHRGQVVFLVETVQTSQVSHGFSPPAYDVAVAQYVQSNYELIGETAYFRLYR